MPEISPMMRRNRLATWMALLMLLELGGAMQPQLAPHTPRDGSRSGSFRTDYSGATSEAGTGSNPEIDLDDHDNLFDIVNEENTPVTPQQSSPSQSGAENSGNESDKQVPPKIQIEKNDWVTVLVPKNLKPEVLIATLKGVSPSDEDNEEISGIIVKLNKDDGTKIVNLFGTLGKKHPANLVVNDDRICHHHDEKWSKIRAQIRAERGSRAITARSLLRERKAETGKSSVNDSVSDAEENSNDSSGQTPPPNLMNHGSDGVRNLEMVKSDNVEMTNLPSGNGSRMGSPKQDSLNRLVSSTFTGAQGTENAPVVGREQQGAPRDRRWKVGNKEFTMKASKGAVASERSENSRRR
jgi:hypothetical protein